MFRFNRGRLNQRKVIIIFYIIIQLYDKSSNIGRKVNMQKVKQEVSKLLNLLPDDCSLEDVQYHLYVLQKIEHGLKDAEEGQIYTQEEVEQRMAKWLEK